MFGVNGGTRQLVGNGEILKCSISVTQPIISFFILCYLLLLFFLLPFPSLLADEFFSGTFLVFLDLCLIDTVVIRTHLTKFITTECSPF